MSGIVARGPMAADHYVRIHNLIVRGAIPTRYVGVYGYIASQSDGWELSAARVAKKLGVGRDFVTSALKAMEQAGLMIRMRSRDANGRLGDAVWFVTDVPLQLRSMGMTDEDLIAVSTRAAFDQWQAARSPVTENPAQVVTSENASLPRSEPNTGFPAQEKPAQGNPAPKKNLSLEDLDFGSLEDLQSNPPAREEAPAPAHPDQGGMEGDQDDQNRKTARELVNSLPPVAGRRPGRGLRAELIVMVATHLACGWKPQDLVDEMTRDLDSARHAGVFRSRLLDLVPVPPSVPQQRRQHDDWCGECDQRTRQRMTDEEIPYRCPECHPSRTHETA